MDETTFLNHTICSITMAYVICNMIAPGLQLFQRATIGYRADSGSGT